MKNTKFSFAHRLTSFILLLAALGIGCHKKTEAPGATVTTATAAETPQTASQTAAAKTTPQPVANTSFVADKISEANVALKTKDYEKAAAVLSTPSQSLGAITGDQLAAYNRASSDFEKQVAAAAAAGDAKAKAVMEKFRQDALYHR